MNLTTTHSTTPPPTPPGASPPGAPKKTLRPPSTVENTISRVVAFNSEVTELFDSGIVGPTYIELVLDHSGSINGPNALLLRTAVAAMVIGTNAHGKFTIPKPSGTTGIINAIKYCRDNTPKEGTIYLFTDGEENCWNGPLIVGKEADGSPKTIDVDFSSGNGNAAILADHLQELGIKVCILGIGAAAKPMVDNMLNRKNVFVGHIEHGADTKSVTSVVRALKRVSKGGVPSVTRNGTQHALLVTLNEEVQESIKNLTPTEMDEIDSVIGSVVISGSAIVCPTDLKRHIDMVFENYDEDITGHEKDIKAAILLAMEAMTDGPMPAALVSSKHSAIIGVPGGWRDFRRHCNRLFSQLAKGEVIQRESSVGDGGLEVQNNGNTHRFPRGCAQYSCPVPKAAITNLAEDEEWSTSRDKLPAPKLKKKRKGSDVESVAKKKRIN